MKIIVRQEPADAENAPGKTCVWIVGDDGETRETSYLEGGQQLPITTKPGEESYGFGPVEQFPAPPEAQQDAPPPVTEPPAGEDAAQEPGGGETLNAPEGGGEAVKDASTPETAAEAEEQAQTD